MSWVSEFSATPLFFNYFIICMIMYGYMYKCSPLCLLMRRDMVMIQRAECFVYPLPLLIANHKQANLSTIQANVRIKKCYFGPKCGLQSARDAASHDSITFDIMLLVPCQSCLLVKAHRELNHSITDVANM